MQPRLPVLRTLITSLLLALVVAGGVAVVARLTLQVPARVRIQEPSPSPFSPADSTLADTTATAAADSTLASAAADSVSGDSTLASAAADTVPGDSTAVTVAANEVPPPAPALTQRVRAFVHEALAAPERWIVVAVFGLTFLASFITAAIAVAGSVPTLVEEGPVRRRSDAVQLLAVLQREGRLLDFLQEEITAYSDAQIGAAVRTVHAGCKKALDEHIAVEPVMSEEEGTRVTVDKGFDPSAVRLTGKVAGDPPFEGAVRHRGWRAREVRLPTDARGQDPEIVAPAEVEVS